MMNYEEFLTFRDVLIKNAGHEKIVRLFYPSLSSVCGDTQVLPNLIGKLLGINLSDTTAITGCFNGIPDETVAPFADVDFYVRFDNDIRLFIYGSEKGGNGKMLKNNEYALFVLSSSLSCKVERKLNRYVYLSDCLS